MKAIIKITGNQGAGYVVTTKLPTAWLAKLRPANNLSAVGEVLYASWGSPSSEPDSRGRSFHSQTLEDASWRLNNTRAEIEAAKEFLRNLVEIDRTVEIDLESNMQKRRNEMETITNRSDEQGYCIYCNHEVNEINAPAVDDDAAWTALAVEHTDTCEWIETRAHRVGGHHA